MRKKKKVGLPIRTLLAMLAVALLLGGAMGGTLAWLTSTPDGVTNTFTSSDINITLAETKGGTNREFKMVPGNEIEKDPKITVEANSEECYLFVKIETSHNYSTYLENYETAEEWTALPDVEGVYYRTVSSSANAQTFSVLKNDKVKVKTSVTSDQMKAIDGLNHDGTENEEELAARPTLKFTAYAIQTANITNAAAAWAELNPTTGDGNG